MFTEKDFEHLNNLWDGKFSDGPTACDSCGACCSNTEKGLYPGEYEYLKKKTGQINSSWISAGCLCWELDNKVKPIICKLFPLQVEVTLDKPPVICWDIPISVYSKNCNKLTVSDAKKEIITEWVNYLFSDIHNRVFHLLEQSLDNFIVDDRAFLKTQGHTLSKEILTKRAAYAVLGLPIQNYFTHFSFSN